MTSNFDRLRAKLDAGKSSTDVMQAQPGPHHTHTCCGICNAYIGDVKQHEEWHRRTEGWPYKVSRRAFAETDAQGRCLPTKKPNA